MLVMAIDGHPEIATYPYEVTGLSELLRGRPWPQVSKEGFLGDAKWLRDRAAQAARDNKLNTSLALSGFDAQGYCETFTHSCREDYARALYQAFLTGMAPVSKQYRDGAPVFAIKLPFFMEAAFARLQSLADDVRLIHLDRNPVARYLSVKAQALARGPIHPRGGMDYTTFHALLHRASSAFAETEPVLHLSYEGLVAQPRAELARVCSFLDIRWSESLLQQKAWGEPSRLPSAHGFVHSSAVDDEQMRRLNGERISSLEERQYVTEIVSGVVEEARRLGSNAFPLEDETNFNARQASLDMLNKWIGEPERIRDMVLNGQLGIM